MKPQLARTFGPRYNKYPCYVQPKLNGIRALYQNGQFVSRDEIPWKPNVLAHLVDSLRAFPYAGILDGELYLHGKRLQKINSAVAVKRTDPTEDTLTIQYHVFDVVDPTRKFSDRWIPVGHALKGAGLSRIIPVPTRYITNSEDCDLIFKSWTAKGYEGIMLRPDGPYEFGRTPHGTEKRSQYLWKRKQWEDGEFLCVGVTQGEGKADIGIGALRFGIKPDPLMPPFFKVGTGFDDDDRREFMLNPPIGKMCKIRYLELTAEGIPFNASFLCVIQ